MCSACSQNKKNNIQQFSFVQGTPHTCGTQLFEVKNGCVVSTTEVMTPNVPECDDCVNDTILKIDDTSCEDGCAIDCGLKTNIDLEPLVIETPQVKCTTAKELIESALRRARGPSNTCTIRDYDIDEFNLAIDEINLLGLQLTAPKTNRLQKIGENKYLLPDDFSTVSSIAYSNDSNLTCKFRELNGLSVEDFNAYYQDDTFTIIGQTVKIARCRDICDCDECLYITYYPLIRQVCDTEECMNIIPKGKTLLLNKYISSYTAMANNNASALQAANKIYEDTLSRLSSWDTINISTRRMNISDNRFRVPGLY